MSLPQALTEVLRDLRRHMFGHAMPPLSRPAWIFCWGPSTRTGPLAIWCSCRARAWASSPTPITREHGSPHRRPSPV